MPILGVTPSFSLLVVIPVAASLLTVIAPLIIALSDGSGVNPGLLMLCRLTAGNCYLLPLDTVTLITYGKGYCSMPDMAKSTIYIQLLLTVLTALCLPVAGKLCGII